MEQKIRRDRNMSDNLHRLRALQSEAASVFYYDAAICTILRDELPYFFSGEQSAKSIAARIQSRVQLYLTEAYG